ncbi:hypothetical protein [Mesobacillus foraminis]|uniref:hypothetical protein n=1 Tax=Mesobacillus foraminis TaxID=279826 RepID=UPI000EF45550|nr:hypothetical protein [Mesobacillus foraminis]
MRTAVLDLANSSFQDHFVHSVLFTTFEQLQQNEWDEFDTIAINGNIDGQYLKLPQQLLQQLWRFVEAGGTIYAELINCEDFPSSRLFGIRQDFPCSYRRLEKLKWNKASEKDYNLLEWNGPFQTGFTLEVEEILNIGIFQDTHRTESDGQHPGLVAKQHNKGRVVYSAIPLFSNDQPWSLRPNWLWNKLISSLQEEYSIPIKPLKPAYNIREQSIEEAVERSIQWFFSSGILPEENGKKGVLENIHSFTKKRSRDIRPDCSAQTALMFWLYGEYQRDEKWKNVAGNLLQFIFDEGFQDEDPQSPSYGLWKWFQFPGEKPDQMFSDDNAWVALVLLYIGRKTENKEYIDRGIRTAKALLETQNPNGIRVEVLRGEELRVKGRAAYASSMEANMNPHFQSIVHAAFIQAFLVTDDRAYLDTALKGTIYLLDHLDDLEFMYSKTAAYSRFLLALSQLDSLTGDPKVKCGLYDVSNYLLSSVHDQGAVEEKDNPAPDRYGKEDTGVFLHNGEGIADQLYTNNFLAMNWWEAWKASKVEEFLKSHTKLSTFLTNIQIHSEDKDIDGGWMRSFHLEKNTYFGNNGDTGWGPYCIESGWTNAVITTGLLMRLLDISLLD